MEVHYRCFISSEKNIIILDSHVLTQLFSIKNIEYTGEKKKIAHYAEYEKTAWMASSC